MIDSRAMEIADAACAGNPPSLEDLRYMLQFDPYGPEAAYANVRARQIASSASGGQAFVFAQIGLDSNPCQGNCCFCSFAHEHAPSGEAEQGESFEVPLDDVVGFAKLFSSLGVHLISCMATASLATERFLEAICAVREAAAPDVHVLANYRDVSLDDALSIRDAGADMAYHACRIGEGRLTDIKPEVRRQTMRNLNEAGLRLMTGVEPLYQTADKGELAERIAEIAGYDPFCIGCCGLSGQVSDTPLGPIKPATTGYIRYVASLTRLVCGRSVPIGGVGAVVWVDAGADPRNRGLASQEGRIRHDFSRGVRALRADGWEVALR